MKTISLLPVLLLSFVSGLDSAKIFFMIPLTSISEKNLYTPLIHELGQRGHQVTVATITKTNQNSKNVHEFVPLSYDEFLGGQEFTDAAVSRKRGKLMMYTFDAEFNYIACHKIFQNKEFQAAISQQYDLIFTNYFCGHCFNGVLYRQGAVHILFNSMPPVPFVLELTGYKVPMSLVPHPFVISTDRMSFLERVENTIYDFYWTNFEKWSYIPESEKIYRKYLGQDIPGGYEIESNVSLIFSNSHSTLNAPIPVLPDIIEVGGIHCRAGNPLPKDLKEWADGAKAGFIYFSLGSVVKATSMPKEWRDIFIQVFSKLKLSVLWKWEGNPEELNLPKNVIVRKWLPQQDILAHPNCRLFMTHGGALSTQESLYHGVPVIGFPIFGDQDLNMVHAENKGFGKRMEILDLAAESLEGTLHEFLTNPKYAAKARELSAIFKDQTETPLKRAVYYTEFALRHKGAQHLRSVGRELSFVQYYLWDVFAFIFAILLLISCAIFFSIRFVLRLLFTAGNQPQNLTKKRN